MVPYQVVRRFFVNSYETLKNCCVQSGKTFSAMMDASGAISNMASLEAFFDA
jgi:hypothetical protein